jgi:hypothetical protein
MEPKSAPSSPSLPPAAFATALVALLAACATGPSGGPTPGAQGFDGEIGGWRAASTGGSGPDAKWMAVFDARAISAPRVMAMVAASAGGEDRFNLFWTPEPSLADGRVSVAVRADGGEVDQGGGPMWRVQDANNYYVCRFNPLESNFRVYVVQDGVRRQLGTTLVITKPGAFHRVEVAFAGDRITCSLNGALLLDVRDATIGKAGGVGLWTKADARTSFDDLATVAQ